MSDENWQLDYVPEGVRPRVERGEVPLPVEDGTDPIRDLRYNIAVAEDRGDHEAVLRYNLQWSKLIAEGRDEGSWTPESRDFAGINPNGATRSDLEAAAIEARDSGDQTRANQLFIAAERAPEALADPDALTAAREADQQAREAVAEGAEFPERERAVSDALKANLALTYQMAGIEAPEPVQLPQRPTTREELTAAANEALAAGDVHAAMKYETAKLGAPKTSPGASPDEQQEE